MTTRTLLNLLKLIKTNKKFLIVSHISPEGDAIGSSIALALGLEKMGKSVYVLNRDPVPDILKFLPSAKIVTRKIPSGKFDVMFIVDCPNMERTGLKNLRAKITVTIDHHLLLSQVIPKQSLNLIDPKASATGELVYKLLHSLHVTIDKAIATNLYTAILTDTGGFRYSNTTPESLKIASRLVAAGADPWEITKEVYENFSFNRLRLVSLCLPTIEKKGKITSITVTRDMFKKTKTSIEDTENIIDFPRQIKGSEVALLFREDRKNLYKISFRSKGKVNVAKIAKTFGGGGHANAAGCKLTGSLTEVKGKIFKAVENAINLQNTFKNKDKKT